MSFFHVIVLNYCIALLHADAIGDDNSKKSKIEPFLNLLLVKFQSAFYPGENLSLDEMVIKWKGRSKYKMYNPNKPEKYHIKSFGLCDSWTGYTYNLLIYFGAETFDDIGDTGQSEKIFHSLLKPLGTGHHLFADQYYMTYKLIEYLIAKKTYCTGTLMANRKYFPNEIKSIKMRHMECAALVNQLLAEADTSKPLDHKQHKIAQPNIPVNSNQPSHLVKWVKNDRNCVVCNGPGQRKRTNHMCDTCNVYLHAKECFGPFHSARS